MKMKPVSGTAHKTWRQLLKTPPWRTVIPASVLVLSFLLVRTVWTPGRDFTDGRHDLEHNGIWLQHGWLGDDSWFQDNDKMDRMPRFRSRAKIDELALNLKHRHITDVFPHLCPTQISGAIMPVNDAQTDLFLREFKGFRVLPWVGGVLDADVTPDIPKRRKIFVASIAELLHRHPQLAGVHLNVEPWPSGDRNMLVLLDELRKAMPQGKLLSVAAYPPPTRWHPFPDLHWEQGYFQQVAQRVDQMVVMMYDTSLKDGKIYQFLMRSWTQQVLDWSAASGGKKIPEILLGVPTYNDAGVGYHNPNVENLSNALLGVHAGLNSYAELPPQYQGVAVYSEWVTSDSDWQVWQGHFTKP